MQGVEPDWGSTPRFCSKNHLSTSATEAAPLVGNVRWHCFVQTMKWGGSRRGKNSQSEEEREDNETSVDQNIPRVEKGHKPNQKQWSNTLTSFHLCGEDAGQGLGTIVLGRGTSQTTSTWHILTCHIFFVVLLQIVRCPSCSKIWLGLAHWRNCASSTTGLDWVPFKAWFLTWKELPTIVTSTRIASEWFWKHWMVILLNICGSDIAASLAKDQ